MNKREKFTKRVITLSGALQLNTAIALLPNLPIDPKKPIELVIREQEKPRKLDQNALMWVGPLADIAEQAYVQGRTYSTTIWHEHFKELFLPDLFASKSEEAEMVKDGYRKYDVTPSGARVLIGSTTQLTIKGFALYLQQVEAFGASLGVEFHANPNDAQRFA